MTETLQELLARVAVGAPAAEGEFGACFVASRLIIPLNPDPDGAPDGTADGSPGEHVELVAQETEPGFAALIAFSDTAAFDLWGRTPRYAVATGIELCGLALTKRLNGLCLNPAGPITVSWDNDEVYALWGRHRDLVGSDEA